MYKVLDKIKKPNDIKRVNKRYLPLLASEIRDLIIRSVSENDGHLASNLGTVELTMALHLFLDLPEDKLIFDVGHQAYTHKILTGRSGGFEKLRQYGGLSGYPEPSESDCDLFTTGHSSTAISLANGLVKSRDLQGKHNRVICVVGDGAISSGLAFEGMNNISRCKSNLIIVLNDNSMSISPNVGGMSKYLSRIRTSSNYVGLKASTEQALGKIPVVGDRMIKRIRNTKNSLKQLFIPGMLFENMGITYIGPIDGHDIDAILYSLDSASQVNGPVIVHCITQKGRGYAPAEKNPSKFHGIGSFDRATGEKKGKSSGKTYSDVFGDTLCELAESDRNVVAVTAAMTDGVGLSDFEKRFHNRFFDVGICEEHGVTFSAGLAKGGLIPFFPVYSTFLQRAYDQILHDVCLNDLHVVFLVDRAGIVGHDGKTHQGIFDISYLTQIPNMTVLAPSCAEELREMVIFAYKYHGPIAIRYPRSLAVPVNISPRPVEAFKADCVREGKDVCILSTGTLLTSAIMASDLLSEQGISCKVINMRFISPFDEETVADALDNFRLTVTLEENIAKGGFGQAVSAFAIKRKTKEIRLLNIALQDDFMVHGDRTELLKLSGLDPDGISKSILDRLS